MTYNEASLTTLGQADPVTELNSKLWNAGDQETARKQKRNLEYHSNILVIKDPGNPENEGKVFLFKYGKKIFEKIMQSLQPQFEDEEPVNVFDFWEGANFKMRIRNVKEFRNYDMSEFDKPSPISKNEDDITVLWNKCHSLQEIVSPDKFKTYEELVEKLNKVLDESDRPVAKKQEPSVKKPAPKKVEMAPSDSDDDDDFDKVFKSLSDDDE